ncbi:immunoglobulin kappa light chain-like, partial [Micropterus salmoides]|uniref:immunoglobulin kappa light chain-like n=1 Tax=Micropterus salmoides TaxID=27706 RepID=UPI0018EBE903
LDLIQSADDPRPFSLTVVEVGGNVTLHCPVSDREGIFFHWYKQSLGFMVQLVATGTHIRQTLSGQFNNPRFKVIQGQTQYSLTIRNVIKEDEATYFCQSGTAYSRSFVNGTFLAVNDRNQQKSVNVKQTPETASVQPGGSVTLKCSLLSKNKGNTDQCPGEHCVYWFRAGSGESHPSIIYSNKNSSDEQEEGSCVYSLSKTIQNSSDAGTYYCAVVTCGEILFSEGTKVEKSIPEPDPVVIVLGVLLVCCVIVIVVLIFCVNQRRVCEHCNGKLPSTPDERSSFAVGRAQPACEPMLLNAFSFCQLLTSKG